MAKLDKNKYEILTRSNRTDEEVIEFFFHKLQSNQDSLDFLRSCSMDKNRPISDIYINDYSYFYEYLKDLVEIKNKWLENEHMEDGD